MSDWNDLGQRLELRNASGKTLGVFLPDEVLRKLVAEKDELREELTKLQDQLVALQAETTQLRSERDAYLRSLHVLMKEPFTFTEQDLEEYLQRGVPSEQVIKDVEEIVKQGPRGSDHV